MNERGLLFGSTKEILLFCGALILIFFANLGLEWNSYSNITQYPFFKTKAEIKSVNIREKSGRVYSAMEFESTDGYRFYSAKNINMTTLGGKLAYVTFDSSKISFIDFLRGFRTRTFDTTLASEQPITLQNSVVNFISSQHEDERLQKLFVSLFFETRLPDELQQKINEFGLSAVMSLSGLNLTLLVGLIFMLFSPVYRYIQDKHFPYRDRKLDLLIFALVLMVFYAYLADFSKPFVRALVMAWVALFLAIRGIKIFNIQTLILTITLIIAFSPRSLFSIGLWLSIAGVYYIFLFLKHTDKLKSYQSYILLGIYVFLAMNVVARHLFPMFTLAQLTSPITSVLFDFFYPIEVVLHFVCAGWLFDGILIKGLELSSYRIDLPSVDWFFYSFLAISLLAYIWRELFFLTALAGLAFTTVSSIIALEVLYT